MDTTKMRLLKGFICVNETRINKTDNANWENLILICRRFWHLESIISFSDNTNTFQYNELFSIINDDKYLKRMEKQYLNLELWKLIKSCNHNEDANGNYDNRILPVGMVQVPLHQFFIAFRDENVTEHICKGKLPVISVDTWSPIKNCQNGFGLGEMRCLLAIGSHDQIENLRISRGYNQPTTVEAEKQLHYNKIIPQDIWNKLQPMQIATGSSDKSQTTSTLKQTNDLLEILQKAVMAPSPSSSSIPSPICTSNNNINLNQLQPTNIKMFKFILDIQAACNLPLNPAGKIGKKNNSKRHVSKRFPPNEPPSCYVTFQADEGEYPTYKSHEGNVYATTIIEKSTQPQWKQRFLLAATTDYLFNAQKRFILKVWKKSLTDISTETRYQPTPMEDAIIGFSALDLTVFLRGLHISGYFNIVDFNGRINGQLEIRCQPIDDIKSLSETNIKKIHTSLNAASTVVDTVIDQFEQSLDLTHLNLSQAIKRKFTELEDISQRLRARLSDVTGTTLPTEFNYANLDKWQNDDDEINDNHELDEFEQDLNSIPVNDENEEKEEENVQTNIAGTHVNNGIEPKE